MLGHTIAEFFGHILIGFTRSVAEHYNFDESKNHLELFRYYALDDTGKEWYCQPVGEVIYQEYSYGEATGLDSLRTKSDAKVIDASSTEGSERTQEVNEDRAMAWKQLRPKIHRTVWSSLHFGFLISLMSATIVGKISIPVYYLGFQTQLNCEDHPKDSIPTILQWVTTISENSFVYFLYYWFFLNILLFFRPFQISGLKLKLVLLCLPFYFLDSAYRIALQVFKISHPKLTPTQRIPAMILFLLSISLQINIITRHFCERPRIKQLKLMLLLIIPCVSTVSTFVAAALVAFSICLAYNKKDKYGKVIMAIFAPRIVLSFKVTSRICVQRMWFRISHPGTSYVLLAPIYCWSAVLLRLLQVDLQSLEADALIGVIHGIAEVIERSTMVFIDHICHKVLENRTIPWGGFRTPRRDRLAAHITIMSMLYESSAIISVNCFLYLYQLFYTRDNSPIQLPQSFALHSSVPLMAEWFFTSASIAIETRYQNMPVMTVWRKRWRRHILVVVINMAMVSIWTSTLSLLTTVQGRFTDKTKDHCEMPFSSGL